MEGYVAALQCAGDALGGDGECMPGEVWAALRGGGMTLAVKMMMAEWAGSEGGWEVGFLREWVTAVVRGAGGGSAGAKVRRQMQVMGVDGGDVERAWGELEARGGEGGERGVCIAVFWGLEVRAERAGLDALAPSDQGGRAQPSSQGSEAGS